MTIEIEAVQQGCCGAVQTKELAGEAVLAESDEIKKLVQASYGAIAERGSGCGCGCATQDGEDTFVGEEYDGREGYEPDADLGLGCGIPTDVAGLEEGQRVLDLGSGAGIDAFIARAIVGETGSVSGVDLTPQMVALATENAEKLGYDNVSFVEGDIEQLPLKSDSFDVVVSNCVLNLVPDKAGAFSEMHRVTAPGGHFCISDIVTRGEIPPGIRMSAEMYAGCVAGALDEQDYMNLLRKAGFENVEVVREHTIDLHEDLLRAVATEEEILGFRTGSSIVSITVRGDKPENQ